MLLLATNVPPAPNASGIAAAIDCTRSKYGPTSRGARSASLTTCRTGTTNVCPGNSGLWSRNATATSSRRTSGAATRPATTSQNTHEAGIPLTLGLASTTTHRPWGTTIRVVWSPVRQPGTPGRSQTSEVTVTDLVSSDHARNNAGEAPLPGHTRVVIDTSVLIADPHCLASFGEAALVIPLTVVEELDSLKTRPDDVGRSARTALR